MDWRLIRFYDGKTWYRYWPNNNDDLVTLAYCGWIDDDRDRQVVMPMRIDEIFGKDMEILC